MYKAKTTILLLLVLNLTIGSRNVSTEILAGHRGYSAAYPENTMVAFEKAIESGCNAFECDVAITSDGVPFIMHDSTLDRTTNGTGICSEVTWSYVSSLDAGSWKNKQFTGESVPSLEKVLEHFKGKNNYLLIEIKYDVNYGTLQLPEKIAQLITDNKMENQCYVFSFSQSYVDRVRSYNKDIITGYLTSSDTSIIDSAAKNGQSFVSFSSTSISKELVDYAHNNNLKICVWTVNKETDIQKMINLGVDWVVGDHADKLKKIAKINNLVT